jgi:phosphate-selective porin OprO and OprP
MDKKLYPLAWCVVANTAFHAGAWAGESQGYDRLWGHGLLYENPGSTGLIRGLALSGRLQADGYRFDADQGTATDLVWRRFRFGFKSTLANNFRAQLEGSFDLNESSGNWYSRLTDAYIGWQPDESLDVKLLKHSAGFTLDGATSSKKLLTLQRNNLTNNLWFTAEYFTGVSAKGELDSGVSYRAGVFSSDGNEELSRFDAGHFTLLSLGYDLADDLKLSTARVRVDYVHNKEHEDANTRDFADVLTLATQWENSTWGLWTDFSAGKAYAEQSDVLGLSVMPFYKVSGLLQLVLRYTYLESDADNGIRFGRYERELSSGRGNQYDELYAGVNLFFYGHKLKWQTGLQYTHMQDDAGDGGDYDGWGLTTGLRVYW